MRVFREGLALCQPLLYSNSIIHRDRECEFRLVSFLMDMHTVKISDGRSFVLQKSPDKGEGGTHGEGVRLRGMNAKIILCLRCGECFVTFCIQKIQIFF